MGDILGLGLTHYPMLAGKDRYMSALLRHTLRDPDIPAEEKDAANWPEAARAEWADDKGLAAAAAHRAELRVGLDRCKEALDAFKPDVVVVWGDDQYENFREEIIPPFCVLAYPDVKVQPFAELAHLGTENVWDLPDDTAFTLRGVQDIGRSLTRGLLERGFDMSYSYAPREGIPFPHAIANTQLYLDYDNAGSTWDYPILPIAVNCYGAHVIARKGGMASFAKIAAGEVLDPPAPSPRRCFEMGRAVAQTFADSPYRVALVASSSWSHAFLNDKGWHLRPDTESDRTYYDALVNHDLDTLLAITTDDLVRDGQQEMLNWFCLLGAMTELDQTLSWSSFVETSIFNSNKVFAVYGADA